MTQNITQQEEVIDVKHLEKSFFLQPVLKNIRFTIRKGENVAIIGKSGSGKSVLIKCLIRLLEPDEGEFLIFNKDMMQLQGDELDRTRTRIGFIFQGAALYDSMTVKENLEFPFQRNPFLPPTPPDQSLKRVQETLASVGMEGTEHKYPIQLSGGMKKRIGLARALIMNPEMIFYDEPTTGLDPITSKEINQLILDTQTKQKATSLIITHDMNCAQTTANRILMLYNGTIYAEGTYDELKYSDDTVIRSFFE